MARAAHLLIYSFRSIKASGIDPLIAGKYSLILPILLGFLLFGRFTKEKWLIRYPTSILMVVGLGITIGTVIGAQIISQVLAIGVNILTAETPFIRISAIIAAIGAITGVSHFLYTRPHTGVLGASSKIGRLYFMVCFGTNWAADIAGWLLIALVARLDFIFTTVRATLGI